MMKNYHYFFHLWVFGKYILLSVCPFHIANKVYTHRLDVRTKVSVLLLFDTCFQGKSRQFEMFSVLQLQTVHIRQTKVGQSMSDTLKSLDDTLSHIILTLHKYLIEWMDFVIFWYSFTASCSSIYLHF